MNLNSPTSDKEFCELQGIQLKYTSTQHPQSNDQVEKANKKIINLLKKKVEGLKEKWVDAPVVL